MSTRYVDTVNWQGQRTAAFAIHELPAGAVALDVDAPTDFFEEGPGETFMIEKVRDLATEVSRRWGLGLFWLYRTLNGMHVLFEHVLDSQKAANDVLNFSSQPHNYPGWRECGGHGSQCANEKKVQLRVGCKPARPWDITSVPGNPPVSGGPAHIQEHTHLLALQLPAR